MTDHTEALHTEAARAAAEAAAARREADVLGAAAGDPDAIGRLAEAAVAQRAADDLIAGYDAALAGLDPAVLDSVRGQYARNAARHLAAVRSADPTAGFNAAARDAEQVVKHDPDPTNRRQAATYLLALKRRTRG